MILELPFTTNKSFDELEEILEKSLLVDIRNEEEITVIGTSRVSATASYRSMIDKCMHLERKYRRINETGKFFDPKCKFGLCNCKYGLVRGRIHETRGNIFIYLK